METDRELGRVARSPGGWEVRSLHGADAMTDFTSRFRANAS